MKVYAYTPYLDSILKNGYISVAKQKNPEVLVVYSKIAGSDNSSDILNYLEKTFEGRSRAVSCLTQLAPEEDYEFGYLDNLVKTANIVSFDLEELLRDGIVEAIYCKDNRESAKIDKNIETIYKINDISEMDFSLQDWHACDGKYGSPFNMIKHYMLVLTDGVIPSKYITKER